MTTVFEDNFDRAPAAPSATVAPTLPLVLADGGRDASDAQTDAKTDGPILAIAIPAADALAESATIFVNTIGPDWTPAQTNAWKIENGRLCGSNARNHGVWLKRILPVNARIEFDAMSMSDDGDLKAEVWGDGQSAATTLSYENATSYLAIFGGWHNTLHVLARVNEHGGDRKVIKIDKTSDDPKEKSVVRGQSYHLKIERSDGKTVRFSVDGQDYLTFTDNAPLAGMGHDHFGFNDWETKVCFDNVKVTPL